MKKGFLVIGLALILMMACAVPALAADIGDADALAEALNDLKTDSASVRGNTVTLEDDIDNINDTLSITGDMTLDLNGYQLSGAVEDDAILLVDGGELEIEDSGRHGGIENTTNAGYAIGVDYGNLTIVDGEIRGATALFQIGGELRIEGGEIEGGLVGIMIMEADGGAYFSGDFTITGGVYGIFAAQCRLYFQDMDGFAITAGSDNPELASIGIALLMGEIFFEDVYDGEIKGADAAVLVVNPDDGLAIDRKDSPLDRGGQERVREIVISMSGSGSSPSEGYLSSFTRERKLSVEDLEFNIDGWKIGENNLSERLVFGDASKKQDAQPFYFYLAGADSKPPYINGYADGSFHMDWLITRAEAAAMLARADGRGNQSDSIGIYTDLLPTHWAVSPIAQMSKAGVITGYPDNTFRPEAKITRGEFVAMVCRLDGIYPATSGASYTDISGHWAVNYIHAAAGAGWLADFSGSQFQPDKQITRLEAVLILNRMLGRYSMSYAEKAPDFSDVPASSPYYDAIMRAASKMQ